MESGISMVERAAKAIYEKRNGAGCRPWSRQTQAYKAAYLDDARAAIEAMKPPTPEMITAAVNANPNMGTQFGDERHEGCSERSG